MKLNTNLIMISLFILLIIPSASAYSFVSLYIDETGKVTFSGETDEQIVFPEGIALKNGIISGETQELTNKKGSIWDFSYNLPNSELFIILPSNSVIKNISNGEIYIDGSQLSIYADNKIKLSYTLNGESSESTGGIFFILFVLIALSAFIYFFRKRKNKPKTSDKLEIIKQVLNDREKVIIDKLKEAGKMKGSYLRRACKIPKASFYRHVLELEKKGLIKRFGEGRNKFIELIKKD